MRYVVGYAAHPRGRDALNLAVALARSMDAALEVVMVVKVRRQGLPTVMHGQGNYQQMVEGQAKQWLTEAAGLIPEGISATYRMHRAESTAAGLMEVAQDVGAGAIIVGGSSQSSWLWHGIGATDNALFHTSPVPVIMAPRGYPEDRSIRQIDCAVSPEPASAGLVEEAVATANRTGLPMRLVALLTGDGAARPREEDALATLRELVENSSVPLQDPALLTCAVGEGESIPEAVEAIDWPEDAVLMAGSSKLAQEGRLFLPSTAAKILTRLPIPVVLVPRDYSPGRGGSEDRPWTGALRIVSPD